MRFFQKVNELRKVVFNLLVTCCVNKNKQYCRRSQSGKVLQKVPSRLSYVLHKARAFCYTMRRAV